MKTRILPTPRWLGDPKPETAFKRLLKERGVDVPGHADAAWCVMEACAQLMAAAPTKTPSRPTPGAKR